MRSIHDWVSSEIDKLKDWTKQYGERIARFSKIANSNASGEGDLIDGPADSGSQEATRRTGTWGVRSRPPAGVDCIVVRVGGKLGGVIVGTESSKYGPSDLKDGEIAIYGKADGKVIKLDDQGTWFLGAADATEFASLGTALDAALHSCFADPIVSMNVAATSLVAMGSDPIFDLICTVAASNAVAAGTTMLSAIAAYNAARTAAQNFQSSFVRVAK